MDKQIELVVFNALDVPQDVQGQVMRLLAPYDPDIYVSAYEPYVPENI